jgi:hypothetical protein
MSQDGVEPTVAADGAVADGSAAAFQLEADEQGKLVLKRPGEPDAHDVRIRRAFPWSSPQEFISIRNTEGKELLLIESLAGLAPELRRLIEQHLAGTIFIPKITRVDSVDVRFGFQEWRVRTDRGRVSFRVQEREDIRFHPDGRFSLRDADGNIYELPPLAQLDDHSRRAVEPLI